MRNPLDPSDEELRQWAQSGLPEPVEDFDLMVAELANVPLLLELVTSPARLFALRCLYLIVGDAVRSNFNTASRADVEDALDRAAKNSPRDPAINRWIDDSRALLVSPQSCDRDTWDGLAYRASEEPSR